MVTYLNEWFPSTPFCISHDISNLRYAIHVETKTIVSGYNWSRCLPIALQFSRRLPYRLATNSAILFDSSFIAVVDGAY